MSTERDDTSYTAPYCSSAMIEAACKLRLLATEYRMQQRSARGHAARSYPIPTRLDSEFLASCLPRTPSVAFLSI